MTIVHRISSFTTDPIGGNPAGVWVGVELPSGEQMRSTAADVGYSETVFAVPNSNSDRLENNPSNESALLVRYYSPEAEVAFCGHATIALGIHLGQTRGAGAYELETRSGEVGLQVSQQTPGDDTSWIATLTSVEPSSMPATTDLTMRALTHLGWTIDQLDRARLPALAFGGANHLILPLVSRQTLASARYDFEPMKKLMIEYDLTTVDLVWHESDTVIHSRNLFAVGGVVEDPATGAAAAAFVGHLRSSGQISSPTDVVIHQGHDMGRPSLLMVHAPVSGGIQVTGNGVSIPPELH